MNKLELKHLAPYLPYGLKYWSKEHKSESILDCYRPECFDNEMKTISMEAILRHPDIYKPILRPLSDICEFIEHKGEEMMLSLMGYGFPLHNLVSEEILKMDYETLTLLFKLHFDVFGLIEKDLAIDINTLK